MTNMELISDYKNNQALRSSFNMLAENTFGLNFEEWYRRGCWDKNYVCYSFVLENEVIANASINKMNLVINGEDYKAIQIGTVMTHPDYRKRGLAAKLINHIISKYETNYDIIYLFANDTVLDFYPKFGFERINETDFSIAVSNIKFQHIKKPTLRKLDPNNANDFKLLEGIASKRLPVSSTLGIRNNRHLLMFYFLIAFPDSIYYIEDYNAIVLFERENDQLHLFDIITPSKYSLNSILNSLITKEIKFIHFHFTPDFDWEHIDNVCFKESSNKLFIRPYLELPKHFLFPATSHA